MILGSRIAARGDRRAQLLAPQRVRQAGARSSAGSMGEVRLHIWPDAPAREDIHGHAWAYESIVLAGELTEIAYREAPTGEGEAMWRHSYRRVQGPAVLVRRSEPGSPRRAGRSSGPRVGDLSGGSHDHVHRFYASLTPAVTLLRVGPSVTRTRRSIVRRREPPPITTPRPTTRDDVRQWIGYVADDVDGDGRDLGSRAAGNHSLQNAVGAAGERAGAATATTADQSDSRSRVEAATPGASRPKPARMASGLPCGMNCTGTPSTRTRGVTPPCSARRAATADPMPPSR